VLDEALGYWAELVQFNSSKSTVDIAPDQVFTFFMFRTNDPQLHPIQSFFLPRSLKILEFAPLWKLLGCKTDIGQQQI